ncbi:hypothetical protein FHR53_002428 [Xanthomonas arboricola]
MSTSAGAHCVHLALAVVLAWQLTAGWALLPASVVLWLCIALVVAGIDRLSGARPVAAPASTPTSDAQGGGTGGGIGGTPAIARLPRRDAAAKRVVAQHVHDTSVRQWRRHIVDVAPYEEERYPRQDICTTVEVFLRAGDHLVLAFHPANDAADVAAWRCDVWHPGGTQSQWWEVPADGEVDVPVTRSGVYSIGIGQAYGTCPGVVALWLRVPEPDRLALPLQPTFGSAMRYARRADGAAVVHLQDDAQLQSQAHLPSVPVHGAPAGSTLLFASADDAWDVSAGSDPASSWRADNTHLYRYFLRLSQGDVLTLELAWAGEHFDRPLPLPDQCTGRTQGEVRVFKLVRGPDLVHAWASAAPAACMQMTCPVDGDYCLELRLFGPPAWRQQAVAAVVDLRVWGDYLQRPRSLRAFALQDVWVEDWYRQVMPVPVD